MLAERVNPRVILVCDDYDPSIPRPDFLDIAEDLLVCLILRGDHDDRHIPVDECDRTVLHLGRRISLGMDIRNFLQLERAFERCGKAVPAPQVKEILRILELARSEERRVGKECRSRWSPYH